MASMSDGVVHLIDDDSDVRHSLTFSLTAAGLAVRAYESALDFLNALAGLQPGCIVSDIRMPGMDGLTLQRQLRERGITMPVILMTGHADVRMAVEAMKAGAVDFIEKPFDDNILLVAIRQSMARLRKADQAEQETRLVRARLETLSTRELQVLRGLVSGLPNKTIAHDLQLSPRTVEVHRANLMTKMGADSLSTLVRMALTGDSALED